MSLKQLNTNPNVFTFDYYIESTKNGKITLEITHDLARRIVALGGGSSLEQRIDTIVDGQTDLNVGYDQRLTKLEALIAKHQHTMQTEHGERYTGEPRMYGTKIDGNHYDKFSYDAHGHTLCTTSPDGSLKPEALRIAADGSVVNADAGDEAAVEALVPCITDASLPDKCDPAMIAMHRSIAAKAARIILAAIKAGKVPGVSWGDAGFWRRTEARLCAERDIRTHRECVAAAVERITDAKDKALTNLAALTAQRDELAALLTQLLRSANLLPWQRGEIDATLARLTPTAPTNGEGDAK